MAKILLLSILNDTRVGPMNQCNFGESTPPNVLFNYVVRVGPFASMEELTEELIHKALVVDLVQFIVLRNRILASDAMSHRDLVRIILKGK